MHYTFHCRRCGSKIFDSEELLSEKNIWDLKDYQAEVYVLTDSKYKKNLKRYDCSLHEGWYCCRFIMMKMVVDKFGTGTHTLVYKDSVEKIELGNIFSLEHTKHNQIRLTQRDFEDLILKSTSNRLSIVKLGAIWCPPCRLMDSVIDQITEEKLLTNIDFFEIDIDEEQKLASKFHNASIPYILFFYKGKQIQLEGNLPSSVPLVQNGIIGGIQKKYFIELCKQIQDNLI